MYLVMARNVDSEVPYSSVFFQNIVKFFVENSHKYIKQFWAIQLQGNPVVTLKNHSEQEYLQQHKQSANSVICSVAAYPIFCVVFLPLLAKLCSKRDRQFLDENCPCQLLANNLSI